ncbi:hypothetical protein LINGRAHAP2_LOCUS14053 [Linum grandiflorum]
MQQTRRRYLYRTWSCHWSKQLNLQTSSLRHSTQTTSKKSTPPSTSPTTISLPSSNRRRRRTPSPPPPEPQTTTAASRCKLGMTTTRRKTFQ